MAASELNRISETAHAITTAATDHLVRCFATDFQRFFSTGLIGSFARGDFTATSDIDYYVIVNLGQSAAASGVTSASVQTAIDGMTDHVAARFSGEPLVSRFSVYWSSLDSLKQGCRGDVGRWPAYDRLAFRDHARHLAGKPISRSDVAEVGRSELVREGAEFMLDTLRVRVDAAGLLDPTMQLDADKLRRMGPILATKPVIIPLRLMYLLGDIPDDRLVVGTDAAIAHCAPEFAGSSWWGLVESALAWRLEPPSSVEQWSAAARLIQAHLAALYRTCLDRYIDALRVLRAQELVQRVSEWRSQLPAATPAGVAPAR